MFFSRPAGHKFVDRGDPSELDFTLANFTLDDTWRELDLSSIIPIGTIAVFISLVVQNTDLGKLFSLRKAGNNFAYNIGGIIIHVANTPIKAELSIDCSVDRKIEYYGSAVGWGQIDIIVKRFVVK